MNTFGEHVLIWQVKIETNRSVVEAEVLSFYH